MSQRILALGEVLWDLFPDGEKFGGAPANFACHAAIHGADVTMISAVGDDHRGHEAISRLREHGIDVSLVQIASDVPTGTVSIELDVAGKPAFTIHEGSAWDQLEWNADIAARMNAASAVYFGTLGQRSELSRVAIRQALQAATDAGVPRVLDVNLRAPFYEGELIRESVLLASILKLSDEELAEVCRACGVDNSQNPEAMLRGLLEFGDLDKVVMTRGAQGAVSVNTDSTVDQAGIPVTVVDTVGAGDAFTAAFLLGELRGDEPVLTLRKACEIAAATCTHAGAMPKPGMANLGET